MQVIVDNLLTNYELQGKGKLVLFLHGWGDNSQGSRQLQKELAKSYMVLAPDLPGFGKTQAPDAEGWSLDQYAEFINHLLTKLNLDQPYTVIGHSNGGAIAIRAAALGLVTPQKIVLLASAGIRAGRTLRRAVLQVLAKTGNLATIGLPERYRQALRKQLYTSAGSDLLAVEGMEATFKKTVKQDVQADAATLSQPVLLVFAENDKAVPLYMAHRYDELFQHAELHIIPNAGHFVHLDEPTQVTNIIQEFLQ